MVLYLGLTRDAHRVTRINGVTYVPLTMHDGAPWGVHPADSMTNNSESHGLARTMFGPWNELPSGAPLTTTLERP